MLLNAPHFSLHALFLSIPTYEFQTIKLFFAPTTIAPLAAPAKGERVGEGERPREGEGARESQGDE